MAEAGGRRSPRTPPSLSQRHDFAAPLARFWQVCILQPLNTSQLTYRCKQSSYAADYLGVILLLVLYILVSPPTALAPLNGQKSNGQRRLTPRRTVSAMGLAIPPHVRP